jgi:hypothetical protein
MAACFDLKATIHEGDIKFNCLSVYQNMDSGYDLDYAVGQWCEDIL